MVDLAIGLAIAVDGTFFALVVVLDPAPARTHKLVTVLAFLSCYLLATELDTRESQGLELLCKVLVILRMVLELSAASD